MRYMICSVLTGILILLYIKDVKNVIDKISGIVKEKLHGNKKR